MTLLLTDRVFFLIYFIPTQRKHYEEMERQNEAESHGFDAGFGHETLL